MSDVQIVLSFVQDSSPADDEGPEAQSSNHTVLHQFPGHSQILSICPYFHAQVPTVSLHHAMCATHKLLTTLAVGQRS
jgi:hypothetical protein